MTRTSTSRLTRRQIERLREIESAPSYLADNGRGMHTARAWWNTYGSLAERGLARLVHCHSGLVAAYEITDSGREVLKRKDERDLVEEAGLC